MKYEDHCTQNHTSKRLCHLGGRQNLGIFSLTFLLMKQKKTDVWCQFTAAIDNSNDICQKLICGSQWISLDETMCAWKPRKTAIGGLPNISFIIRKPEPLCKI
jgi:hypothetical protein